MLELEGGRARYFNGTWHQWRREKAARDVALGRAIERQEAEIARLERFVDRFRAGTRARQAQSRQKKLDRMQRVERDPAAGATLGFAFKPPERSGRVVFEVDDGRVEVGGRTLLDHAELWLERGEHVSLVGPNGSGKTTLISVLAGERELAAGKLRRGHNVKLGVLSQHAEEIVKGAHPNTTVLEAAQKATGLKPNETRALLGRFLFGGEGADKPVAGLSGGERRRLSLAVLVQSGANVLVLDEPTNHLDLESREALEAALGAFPGSLLLVSHDRALLDAVGTRTVAVEDGTLHSYLGGWAEYVRVREERAARARRRPPPTARRARRAPPRARPRSPRARGAPPRTLPRSLRARARRQGLCRDARGHAALRQGRRHEAGGHVASATARPRARPRRRPVQERPPPRRAPRGRHRGGRGAPGRGRGRARRPHGVAGSGRRRPLHRPPRGRAARGRRPLRRLGGRDRLVRASPRAPSRRAGRRARPC